ALDRPFRELRGAALERHRVHRPEAREPTAARQLERPRECDRLAHGVSLEGVRVRAVLLRADSKVELIRGLPLFELCSKRDLRRIAALAEERAVEPGS